MANSTTARDTPQRGIVRFFPNVPVAAGEVLLAGNVVALSAAGNAGVPSATYTKVIGIVEKSVTGGAAAGDKTVNVLRGEFFLDNDGTNALTKAHVGPLATLEWTDDHTAANTSSTSTVTGGTLIEIVAADSVSGWPAGVWVEFP